jgi:hypothetical protein
MLKKQIWANFQRIIELFAQKIVTKLSKIWVWDLGSRGQKGTGSRIRIRNTVWYLFPLLFKYIGEKLAFQTINFSATF